MLRTVPWESSQCTTLKTQQTHWHVVVCLADLELFGLVHQWFACVTSRLVGCQLHSVRVTPYHHYTKWEAW
jgi:hypothetical protein